MVTCGGRPPTMPPYLTTFFADFQAACGVPDPSDSRSGLGDDIKSLAAQLEVNQRTHTTRNLSKRMRKQQQQQQQQQRQQQQRQQQHLPLAQHPPAA